MTSDLELHAKPRFPRGFRCMSTRCGLKEEGEDLSLFASSVPCAAAALFTRNLVPGAPVVVGRELIRGGRLQAVVANSKVSNVGTGPEGIAAARRMGEAAAAALGISPELVLMSSTGVIARPLPIELIEAGLRGAAERLQDDPLEGARGIMTTDTHPKALSLSVGDATITLVGKGSGMVEPNLATMLVFGFTDARLEAAHLDAQLREAARVSFNMLSVDTDTSTSDTVAFLANGLAGEVGAAPFQRALTGACVRLAEILARDGEGATKLLRVTVEGAASEDEARRVARSVVSSPLVKTMAYGGDPNVGRILMAVGKCFDCHVEPGRLAAWIGEVEVLAGGRKRDFDEVEVRAILQGDPLDLRVDLGVGSGRATAFGCDLTPGYVQENAAYYST